MDKTTIHIMHTTHLDLFWMGSQETCLEWGSQIIRDAARIAEEDTGFYFMIETVRFLEYIYTKYPEEKPRFAKLFANGQFTMTAAYVDSYENPFDGECHVRNVLYGRKLAKQLAGLSPRERELVTLVARGRTDAQIAAELFISPRTVSSHLDRIRDKTGARRRADLTRLALTGGLV